MKCPKCNYEVEGTSSGLRQAGMVGVTVAAVAGISFLVGGPVGSIVGGGLAGKLLSKNVNKGCKEAAKNICYRCPKCGTIMTED